MKIATILSIIIIFFELIFITSIISISRKQKVIISKNTIFLFVPIFIFLLCLYIIGVISQANPIRIIVFIEAIVSAIKSFAFEINTKYIEELLKNNIWYAISFYIAYLLAVITVTASAAGLIKDYILNIFRVRKVKNKEADILIGYNEDTIQYAKHNRDKCILWIEEELDNSERAIIYQEKIPFIKANLTIDNMIRKLNKHIRYNFINFKVTESKYQELIDLFVNVNKVFDKAVLHLEVEYKDMDIVRRQYLAHRKNNNLNLYIKTFSRYELIARKFAMEYTLPKYINDSWYYPNRSIKEEKEINIFLLGFGKVNTSIFTTFCQNNQLTTMKDGKLIAKPVNYYIVDKDISQLDDKRIEYILKNYQDFESNLPPLEIVCNFNKIEGDLYSESVISKIRNVVKANNESLNLFIVSFGDDLDNIELASWLNTEFGYDNNFTNKLVVFCRVKNSIILDKDIFTFGNENEIVSHSYIVDEELQQLAKDINYNYEITKKDVKTSKDELWSDLSQIKLFSNFYSAMNIRFKLNLLGLDITKSTDIDSISKDEFLKIYGKKPDGYDYNNYFDTTTRNVIAYSEKLRWNAFYIFNGYKPMLIEKEENGKSINIIEVIDKKNYVRSNDRTKTHACLTSYRGLHLLHEKVLSKMKELKINATIKDVELYAYDYMVFDNPDDNLFDRLIDSGYKIFRMNNPK